MIVWSSAFRRLPIRLRENRLKPELPTSNHPQQKRRLSQHMGDRNRAIDYAHRRIVNGKSTPRKPAGKQAENKNGRNQFWKAAPTASKRNRSYLPHGSGCADQWQGNNPYAVVKHFQEYMQRDQHVARHIWQKLRAGMLRY